MAFRIRNQKDVAAGLVYVATGSASSLGALAYKMGDPARMGPGWFPFWVGVLLALVGVATALSGLRAHAAPEKIKRPEFGAMAWILGGVVLFGLLLPSAGLVVSLVVLVLVASRGSHEFTWLAASINAAVLTLFSIAAFIWGISLQIPLWPAFLR